MANNTIILLEGTARLTGREMKKFNKYDTILGCDSNPTELKRWSIEQIDEAKAELAKYKCEYDLSYIAEYALEYCECDEDGEFIQGSDYDFAEEV